MLPTEIVISVKFVGQSEECESALVQRTKMPATEEQEALSDELQQVQKRTRTLPTISPRVRLTGLTNGKYNYHVGRLLYSDETAHTDEKEGRVAVSLCDGSKQIKVNPAHTRAAPSKPQRWRGMQQRCLPEPVLVRMLASGRGLQTDTVERILEFLKVSIVDMAEVIHPHPHSQH